MFFSLFIANFVILKKPDLQTDVIIIPFLIFFYSSIKNDLTIFLLGSIFFLFFYEISPINHQEIFIIFISLLFLHFVNLQIVKSDFMIFWKNLSPAIFFLLSNLYLTHFFPNFLISLFIFISFLDFE